MDSANRNFTKIFLNGLSKAGGADDPQMKTATDAYEREAHRILGDLNYKKLTYLNTSSPERLIALIFAKGCKEAFDLPAFFMGEKAYALVSNRDAYERVLGRFDKVLPYPEKNLDHLTEGISADGIKAELSAFSCSRSGRASAGRTSRTGSTRLTPVSATSSKKRGRWGLPWCRTHWAPEPGRMS